MSGGKRPQAILIHGEQPLLVEDELKKMLAKVSREEVDLEFNLDIFRMGEDALEDALTAAETLPFASGWRYVVIKEAQRLSPGEIKRLSAFLDRPPESAFIFILAVGLKKNSPLIREFRKKAAVKEAAIARREIPLWIKARFEERGLRVDGRAVPYLLDMLGDDLYAIEAAVEKIALFHQGDKAVELEEVVALVLLSAEKAVYELTDRVMVGDSDQALKILRRLLRQGEDPNHILYGLSRHFLRLLRYRALREEGMTEQEIARELKIPSGMEWTVGARLRPQAARLDEDGLREALSCLVGAERDLKTGRRGAEDVLVSAVIQLTQCSSSGRSRRRAGTGRR